MLPSLVVGEHSSGTLFSELWQAIFFHITCDNELNDIHSAPPVSEYSSCIAFILLSLLPVYVRAGLTNPIRPGTYLLNTQLYQMA